MSDRNGSEIAVIGLSGRFPGAASVEELWRNLCGGVESLTVFADEELRAAGVPDDLIARPEYVRARGVLPGIEGFDAPFFETAPREAEILDPQHRIFLECAWEALESAGYDPRRFSGAVGVFAGASFATYLHRHVLARPEVVAAVGESQALLHGERDFLAGRVSYKLDLSGPSLAVQTACSTSLVAVHLACQMLLAGECDLALAGGVSVRLPQVGGQLWQEGGTLSKDGHCRAFDAAASGSVSGSGAGVVVLRPLEDALEAGDHVWAVIRGSAMNNDGAARVGFAAPGVEGQSKVIEAALGVAEVEPETIGLVEAHGSGSPLGDRIELAALHRAFGAAEGAGRRCALGSIKPNVGHLDAAAGIASLIKAVLCLHHKALPPTLHFETPNAELAREDSPFRVLTRLEEWEAEEGAPRRAAVNAFGMGGTNAHVVLEEAPEPGPAAPAGAWHVLPLSARTETALEAQAERLAAWLEAHPEAELADVAWTLQTGRRGFAHRRVVVCRDREEAVRGLRGPESPAMKSPGYEQRPMNGASSRVHPAPFPARALMPGAEGGLIDLWLSGGEPDWAELHPGEGRRRVPLPTYPFERQRYWIDPPQPVPAAPAARPSTHDRPRLSTEYEPPGDETERVLVEIWEEVFGISPVGVLDGFAELGGHSLLATQIQSRVRDRLGAALPLASVVEAGTVAALARIVSPGSVRAPERIPPRPAGAAGRFPVSFSQLRLWLLDRIEPGTPAYNIPMPLLLEGALDRGVLERCLAETVRRHEALRTVFALEENEPVQVVLPPWDLALPLVDLSGLAEAVRDPETTRLMEVEAQTGFDLSRGPLLRAVLVRHGAERHALLVNIHHIVTDGWSLGVWFREIGALYEAWSAGRPSPLPELPIQYADFAVWQRRSFEGPEGEERLRELLGYWRRQLADASPALDLPADRPRPAVRSSRGDHEVLRLEPDLAEGVQGLARSADATPFMVLLAAFQALLFRLTGQEDPSVGTFIANRNRAEIEGLIGFFVNTLVLRTDLGGAPTFRELLGRVREVTFGAYAHQDLPLERLIEELQPRRDPSRTPLFQVMLILQNVPEMSLRLPDLTMSFLPLRLHRSNFDLTLWTTPVDGGFSVDAEYPTALFDASTVRRLLGHFRNLLAAAVADPDAPVARLPLMDEDERRQVLVAWNDTAAELGAEVPVHLRIQEQARRTPEAPAVIGGSGSLNYGELEDRAEALAAHLRDLGAGPEAIVGVALRRSPEMIVGLLGVLKSGAAYLPLDPELPRERREMMLRDAGVSVVLVDEPPEGAPARSPGREPRVEGAPMVPEPLEGATARGSRSAVPGGTWNLLSPRWGLENRDDPQTRGSRPGLRAGAPSGGSMLDGNHPDSPAYVIYTSGSTGVPKGVVVTHGGLANHTASAVAEYGLRPGDRVLQFAAVSFDTSAEEIFPCLAAGAALVLRDDSMVTSAADFLRAVDRLGITVLDLPTAFWHELAAGLERGGVPVPAAVRLVILGGEKALADRLAAWHRGVSETRLVNTYGPTEGTIVATRCDLPPLPPSTAEPPIGRPIHNVRAYVLDRALEPVPVGAPGELCLAGAGLARGYLRRPELTAEKFVPDPFENPTDRSDRTDRSDATGLGGRLYRTGDLVRWRPGGELEFLGRVDRQVKIRGFRVEIGEVEKALREHPGVADGVVETSQDASGSLRLVAYVVPGAEPPGDLRAWLRERLPEHMVPSVIVSLAELPKTASGKIDRRALPAPERSEPDAAYVPPQSELERIIAGIWQEVLGIERVGVHDNFFELGGHSLLVVQVHGRLREALGREIDVVLLFQRPTVASLARELRQGDAPPAFAEARELVMQQRTVNERRKQMMEQMMQQRRGRRP